VPVRVHSDQRSFLKLQAAGMQGTNDDAADGRRENVLSAKLDDTWPASLSAREQRPKISVVSENDETVRAGEVHDERIRRGRLADAGPMDACETGLGKEPDPTTGSSSCRSGASCTWKRHFDLFDAPSGIGESLPNILLFEVRIGRQDFTIWAPGRHQADNSTECDTHSA